MNTLEEIQLKIQDLQDQINKLNDLVNDLYKNQESQWEIIEEDCLPLNKVANK